jgi:hypothetical protein
MMGRQAAAVVVVVESAIAIRRETKLEAVAAAAVG